MGFTAWHLQSQLPEERGLEGGRSGDGPPDTWMRTIDKRPFLLVILRACSEWERTPETDDVTLPHLDAAPGIALLFMGRWASDSGWFSSVGMAVPECPSDSKTRALGT